jgi:hypothetical protein
MIDNNREFVCRQGGAGGHAGGAGQTERGGGATTQVQFYYFLAILGIRIRNRIRGLRVQQQKFYS